MIDEYKLIKDIEMYFDEEETEEDKAFNLGLKTGIIEVKRQPKLNEWIPIEKELPKTKGEYLVSYHPCYRDNVLKEIRVGLDSFRGKSSWKKKEYQKVIAWMPSPKPYGGNENDYSYSISWSFNTRPRT